MSPEQLAEHLVNSWDELSIDSKLNREMYLSSLLREFQRDVIAKTGEAIFEGIKPQ